jgi:hypothetical protein
MKLTTVLVDLVQIIYPTFRLVEAVTTTRQFSDSLPLLLELRNSSLRQYDHSFLTFCLYDILAIVRIVFT